MALVGAGVGGVRAKDLSGDATSPEAERSSRPGGSSWNCSGKSKLLVRCCVKWAVAHCRLSMAGRWKRGLWAGVHQRLAHAVAQEVMQERLMPEANFGLRGMDIHVHFAQWHLDKQEYDREIFRQAECCDRLH